MVDYYDKLLIAIPTLLLTGALVGTLGGVSLRQGLASGSLLASVLMYEMMFRNPPTEPRPSQRAAPAVVGVGWLLVILL